MWSRFFCHQNNSTSLPLCRRPLNTSSQDSPISIKHFNTTISKHHDTTRMVAPNSTTHSWTSYLTISYLPLKEVPTNYRSSFSQIYCHSRQHFNIIMHLYIFITISPTKAHHQLLYNRQSNLAPNYISLFSETHIIDPTSLRSFKIPIDTFYRGDINHPIRQTQSQCPVPCTTALCLAPLSAIGLQFYLHNMGTY